MNIKLSIFSATLLLVLMSLKLPGGKPKAYITGPAAIIYKTKADYSKNVPVTLSDDKLHVVSYPAPQDVYFHGELAYPTQLAKGFLLDNRGISVNSAFISLTYEEYSKLPAAPDPEEPRQPDRGRVQPRAARRLPARVVQRRRVAGR